MTVIVAGATGLAGSAIVKAFESQGQDVIGINRSVVDLMNTIATEEFIAKSKPSLIVDAAAKVGGIGANNSYPVEFLSDNIAIQGNLMRAAHKANVPNFVFLGSSCIYPRDCAQPIKEEYLLTGPLEETNSAYAIAKIAGIKMCESYNRQYGTDYRSILPCNLYGPGDNYDEENGHLAAGVIQRLHRAKLNGDKQFVVWGTGKPRREFVYVDDMAEAAIQVMNVNKTIWDSVTEPMQNFVNVGAGQDIEISEFVEIAKKALDFDGEIVYDTSKPDGTMNKLTDNSRITKLGWTPKTDLSDGLKKAYEWYVTNIINKSTTV
jgi:GDP-L-fucose synthase